MTGGKDEQGKPAYQVYYSYAQQDEAFCLELAKYLNQLEREDLIKGWHRGMIPGGADEAQEIESHRQHASVILLLISPAYLSTNACYDEMHWAWEREQAGEKHVIPIILRAISVEPGSKTFPFKTTQLLPTGGRPITDWRPRDKAYQDIVMGVRRKLEQEAPHRHESTPSLIWNIPHTRNPFFTGREDLLQQLHTNLADSKAAVLTQPQAISGLGGIGKTQTAVEYAYRHRDDYHYILWVNADTRDTIITSFLQIATLLKLPEREAQDQNVMIAAVKHWFTNHDGWLVIFDNADDLSIVEDFLPVGGRGHLLITTRVHASGALANSLAVEQMDMQEAMLLLLRRARVLQAGDVLDKASATDRAIAETIAREMDGLPLALDQAGAYIEETQCSLTSYLNQYRKRQHVLLKRRGGTGKQHPESVATTWSLSFEQVEKLNPIAAHLLRFLSFLAPDAVPEQLIIDGASQLGPTLQPLADDESLLDEAIAALARYSLVKRKREDSTLTVHRLVQAVIKNSLDEQTQRRWSEYTIRAVNDAFPDVADYRTWPSCQLFLPHTQACAVLIDQWQFAFEEAGKLCNQVGYYLKQRAQYAEAEIFYERAIAIGEKTLGSEHPNMATWLNNLALLYYSQGKYEQAEPLYRRAIAIGEKTLGTEHPDLAIWLNNLALLYYSQGKYENAEPLYQRTIAIDEKMLGSEHPNLATDLNNLANLYSDQGKYEQAEPLYQRAIAIFEKVLGLTHPSTITAQKNYAGLLRRWKKEKGR